MPTEQETNTNVSIFLCGGSPLSPQKSGCPQIWHPMNFSHQAHLLSHATIFQNSFPSGLALRALGPRESLGEGKPRPSLAQQQQQEQEEEEEPLTKIYQKGICYEA